MGEVVFTGSVSAQAQAGETVTLTVTKPDATTDVFTTTTLADLTFTPVSRTYGIAGDYSVVAHVDADARYKATDSEVVPFTIALEDRAITVNVTIS